MTATNDDTLLRALVLLLAVFVLFPVLMMLFAVPMLGMMGSGVWNGSAWVPNLLTGFFWLLVVVLLIYGGYRFLVRDSAGGKDPAIAELRLAYARGELSDEEYENRLERLESSE